MTDKIGPEPVLKEIAFKFKSSAGPEQMIELVSRQFGGRSRKQDWSKELAGVKLGFRVWLTGGIISEWDQGDGQILTLSLIESGAPNEYILKLRGGTVSLIEEGAILRQQREREDRARSVNPSPRF